MTTETTQTPAAPKQPKAARKAKQSKKAKGKKAAPALRRCCAAVFRNFAKYTKTVTVNGNQSADNGDAVAKQLRNEELPDVYARAAKVLGVSVASLKAKYSGLNPGMQRMNLGNRIRGATAAASKAK